MEQEEKDDGNTMANLTSDKMDAKRSITLLSARVSLWRCLALKRTVCFGDPYYYIDQSYGIRQFILQTWPRLNHILPHRRRWVFHSSVPRVGPGGGCPWRWPTSSGTRRRCCELLQGPSCAGSDSSGRTAGLPSPICRSGPAHR